jgi:hypothetical protein
MWGSSFLVFQLHSVVIIQKKKQQQHLLQMDMTDDDP